MKIFNHWRNVGRAMLDARRREGVTHTRTIMLDSLDEVSIDHLWSRTDGTSVWITWITSRELVDIRAGGAVSECALSDWDNAAQALRVLAALDLIPAHLAYGDDERYGRCEVCGELAQWVASVGPFADRWCHLNPTRPFHTPEVPHAA